MAPGRREEQEEEEDHHQDPLEQEGWGHPLNWWTQSTCSSITTWTWTPGTEWWLATSSRTRSKRALSGVKIARHPSKCFSNWFNVQEISFPQALFHVFKCLLRELFHVQQRVCREWIRRIQDVVLARGKSWSKPGIYSCFWAIALDWQNQGGISGPGTVYGQGHHTKCGCQVTYDGMIQHSV